MRSPQKSLLAFSSRHIHRLTLVAGLQAICTLCISTAHADATKHPRDGRYCNGALEQTDKGTIDPGPFFMLGMAIVPTLHTVAICDGDVESVKSYWRSYYRYFGCTAESDIGKSIELSFEYKKNIYDPRNDAAWIYIGENPQFCETIRNKCILPPVFDPEVKNSIPECKLDELLNELKRGVREIKQRDTE